MLPRTLEPEVMDTVEEAVDYDSMDHSAVNALFVGELLDFVAASGLPTTASRALDMGTGTALIPIQLMRTSDRFSSVLACDLSQEMLRLARKHICDTPLEKTILPVFCDAKKLPVADASCAVVMSNSIVHHIPQPADVFVEMRRIITPDGVLFVRDLMRPESSEQVEHIVATYAGDENDHQQQMFRESLHAALTVEEVGDLLTAAGFPRQWVQATSDRHWTIAGRLV
ncbi:MAG: methyltransferase domain-containing protein [Planctomycetaceae bacterium]|nr:methyltransferase domain-containing protein [Planctomycetaceae bacterium]